MFLTYLLYTILIVIFFVFSGLIIRHNAKFGFLSPRFKTIVIIFGLLAIGIVIFSLYMLLQLRTAPSSSPSFPSTTTTPTRTTPSTPTDAGDFSF